MAKVEEVTSKTNRIVAKRRADMPPKYRKLYDRCTSGEASPREAIKAQCLECWGWDKRETEQCDNVACPLYELRPYQESQKPVKSPSQRLQRQNSNENLSEGS